jgi:hypothetical protein
MKPANLARGQGGKSRGGTPEDKEFVIIGAREEIAGAFRWIAITRTR